MSFLNRFSSKPEPLSVAEAQAAYDQATEALARANSKTSECEAQFAETKKDAAWTGFKRAKEGAEKAGLAAQVAREQLTAADEAEAARQLAALERKAEDAGKGREAAEAALEEQLAAVVAAYAGVDDALASMAEAAELDHAAYVAHTEAAKAAGEFAKPRHGGRRALMDFRVDVENMWRLYRQSQPRFTEKIGGDLSWWSENLR